MSNRNNARVLVVDDEESVCLYLGAVLESLGCLVATADTAGRAWERVTESPGLDLVLLDKNLPDRSGLDLLAELKGHDPDLEVVMITAYASLDSAVTALRFGAGDFLTKPFDDIHLLSGKLSNALERARRARERTRFIADLKEQKTNLEAQVVERTHDLQAALAELERRDAERRRLMANLGHDLRTPLTTIQGYVEMLLRGSLCEERRLDYLNTMLGQCRRLGRLTRDLTFLARQADGRLVWRFAAVDTGALLEAAVKEVRPLFDQIDVQVAWTMDDCAKEFFGDEDRLMQVLANLLANAAKFAPGGSIVRVHAGSREDSIEIAVSDSGVGVPVDQRTAIFERYQTGDISGRGEGIGLSICLDIATAHGGSIWVDDADGGGARFTLAVPSKPEGKVL